MTDSAQQVRGLKHQYPDYLDDPDGLERFRQDVLHTPGHDMAKVNHNSLGRLVDTIDRLVREKDDAVSKAQSLRGRVDYLMSTINSVGVILGFDLFGKCPICDGVEGCSHSLRERINAARPAALASVAQSGVVGEDVARTFFERGFIAAAAWSMTKRDGDKLSDATIDHAWAHRDEGMDFEDMLPALAAHPSPAQPPAQPSAVEAMRERLRDLMGRVLASGHVADAALLSDAIRALPAAEGAQTGGGRGSA